jgi:hypothetical protein
LKGKRLYQLVQELNKTEHRQLVNACKLSADKRSAAIVDLLRKRNLTEKSFELWLSQLVSSWNIKTLAEQDRNQRRWVDFACKEVEKLLLKNRLEDSHAYNHELSSIFDLRNHEDLTAYYNKKAIDEASQKNDYSKLIAEYDISLRWLGRNQSKANIAKIAELLMLRKEVTELHYHENMSYFYSVSSALYIDNPGDVSYKRIVPAPTEFNALKKTAKDEYSLILYMLAEARFHFYQPKKFESLLTDAMVSIENAKLDEKSKILLQRNWLYLRITGGIYYQYPLGQMIDDASRMFNIQLKYKMHDTIGFFFLLFFLLLKGDIESYEGLLRKHRASFFTDDSNDYLHFLQALKCYLKGEIKQAIGLLMHTSYSQSSYIATWSRLLEIKIHLEEGDIRFTRVLLIRAKRLLKISKRQRLLYEPASATISALGAIVKGQPAINDGAAFQYYHFILQNR